MPEHHIRYDLLAQQALREVVRSVLADVAKDATERAPAGEHQTARKPAALPRGKSAAGKKSEPAAPSETVEPPSGGDDKPDGGGEVVRLDRFRKK